MTTFPMVPLLSPLTPFAPPGCTSQLRATYALDNSEGEKLTLLGELLKLIVLLERAELGDLLLGLILGRGGGSGAFGRVRGGGVVGGCRHVWLIWG